jgi:hypothetical protein
MIRHGGGVDVQLRQKIARIQSTKGAAVARSQQCCEPPVVIVFEKTRDFVASADFEQEKLGNRLLLRTSAGHREHVGLLAGGKDALELHCTMLAAKTLVFDRFSVLIQLTEHALVQQFYVRHLQRRTLSIADLRRPGNALSSVRNLARPGINGNKRIHRATS